MLTKNQENLINELKDVYLSLNKPKQNALPFIQRLVVEVEEENIASQDALEYNKRVISELMDDLLRQVNEIVESLDEVGIAVSTDYYAESLESRIERYKADVYKLYQNNNSGFTIHFKSRLDNKKNFEIAVRASYSVDVVHSKKIIKYESLTFDYNYSTLKLCLEKSSDFSRFVKGLLNSN